MKRKIDFLLDFYMQKYNRVYIYTKNKMNHDKQNILMLIFNTVKTSIFKCLIQKTFDSPKT